MRVWYAHFTKIHLPEDVGGGRRGTPVERPQRSEDVGREKRPTGPMSNLKIAKTLLYHKIEDLAGNENNFFNCTFKEFRDMLIFPCHLLKHCFIIVITDRNRHCPP